MKRFLFYAMLSITCATLFIGCEKGSESYGGLTIYGTVIDAYTGDPIQNAQISVEGVAMLDSPEQYDRFVAKYGYGDLEGSFGSTVTGSDGTYEFTVYNLKNEFYVYSVRAEKASYSIAEMALHLSDSQKGGRQKFDFLLYKK